MAELFASRSNCAGACRDRSDSWGGPFTAQFERLANSSAIRLVGPAEELVLSDGPARHRTTWKWLVGAMLLSLVGEMIAAARWRPIAPEGTS